MDAARDYTGLTGPTELNEAGDRSLGNYDFWAVCEGDSGYEWVRAATYTAGVEGGAGQASGLRPAADAGYSVAICRSMSAHVHNRCQVQPEDVIAAAVERLSCQESPW